MHIGLDGIPLTEPKTGVGHYTFELAVAMARVSPDSNFEIVYPSNLRQVTITDDARTLPSNLEIKRIRVGPVGRYWWSAGLPRYVRRNGIDLFHGTNYDVPPWHQCATVLTIHDLSLLIHPETHEKRRVRRSRRRLPLMARAANAIIVPTESVRREVCEHLGISPQKVFAIPESARDCFTPMEMKATEHVRERLGIGDNFLLTVGTLEPRKNLLTLVRAVEEIANDQPTLQLVIAGSRGWLSEPLFEAIEKSPAKERIVLTEYLNDDDLRALYSSCSAFVYPSIYEGFGLPPLEAMACGAPVIATGVPSVIASGARVISATDVNGLARNIVEFLSDARARESASAAGLTHASKFSWEQTAMLTREVYNEALTRSALRDG